MDYIGGMVMEERELVRVGTRISAELNDWLDIESKKTGLSKSSIMMIATENYKKEKEVIKGMADMGALVAKIERLEEVIQRKGLE